MKTIPIFLTSFARATTRLAALATGLGCAAAALATTHTPDAHEITANGMTATTVRFNVYVPAGYNDAGNSTRHYPVIYFLHGLGGNEDTLNDTVLDAYDAAITRGDIEPSIVVFPDGHGDSFWADSWDGAIMAETDLLEAVIPHVEANYRTLCTSSNHAYRIIMGFSMGGFGAAKFAAKFPEIFSAAVIIDGALQTWAEMTRTVPQHGNPASAAQMFNNVEANYNLYSPWTYIVSNSTNIENVYHVPFRQLAGMFGSSSGNNNYAYDFHVALDTNGITNEFWDTLSGHNLPNLMAPPGGQNGGSDLLEAQECWAFIQDAYDNVLVVLPPVTSTSANDGWVLETTANNSGGQNLVLGENTSNQRYRAILSFDTSAIPVWAIIDSATLTLTRTAINGTLTGLGSLKLDIKTGTFGSATVENSDGTASATASNVATLSIPGSNGATTSANLNATGCASINSGGTTQFRLAFDTADTGNSATQTVSFGAGDNSTTAYQPTLAITYH